MTGTLLILLIFAAWLYLPRAYHAARCELTWAERAALLEKWESLPTVPSLILDPFGGAGTTGLVADRLGRDAILIELNSDYANMARERIAADAPMFAEAKVIDESKMVQ